MSFTPRNIPPTTRPGTGVPPARAHVETTFGYICTECDFYNNQGYAGYAMGAVQDHCMETGHLVKAGLDV